MQFKKTIDSSTRKKVTSKAIFIFIVTLVLLTFFSNTINNFTLPRVTTEVSQHGDIIKGITGDGTIEVKETVETYASSNTVVKDVNVEVGDKVKKGQVIMVLDTEELTRNLMDEKARYEQKKLSLEKLMAESIPGVTNSYERNVEAARIKVELQQNNYDSIKELFTEGAESAQNLEKAEDDLENAKREYEAAKIDKEKSDATRVRDIKNLKFDLEIQQRSIEKLEKELDKIGVMISPCDGIVSEINFPKGSITNNSKPLYKIKDTTKGFQLIVTIDKDKAKYLKEGEKIDVYVDALGEEAIIGKIAEISSNDQNMDEMKDIRIYLNHNGLTGGEQGEINAKKNLKTKGVLVSNDAIHEDNDGEYVLVVKEKKGPLGNEYYVEEARVSTGESDDSKTVVTDGLRFIEKIVVKSSKSLEDGDRVMVEK